MPAEILFPENCTGCSACAAVCPHNALILEQNHEGFGVPRIQVDRCNGCRQCLDICPVLHSPACAPTEPQALGVVSRDEALRSQSSSGGVFGLLARQKLATGGWVIGAAWNERMDLQHACVNTETELFSLLGSKYVQSDMGGILRLVSEQLKQGRPGVFAGTPCQVAGLRAYLQGRPTENLLVVDLVCHGVPSPRAWSMYLQELEARYQSRAVDASFRDKSNGWRQYDLTVRFQNGKFYRCGHRGDPYMWLFLRNVSLRSSCYDCPFKGLQRHSDLTLADFWGVEEIAPDLDDDRGTSLVLVHTAAGREALQNLSAELNVQPVDIHRALKANPMVKTSVTLTDRRERYFSLLGKKATADIVNILVQEHSPRPTGPRNWLKRLFDKH